MMYDERLCFLYMFNTSSHETADRARPRLKITNTMNILGIKMNLFSHPDDKYWFQCLDTVFGLWQGRSVLSFWDATITLTSRNIKKRFLDKKTASQAVRATMSEQKTTQKTDAPLQLWQYRLLRIHYTIVSWSTTLIVVVPK